MNEVFSWLNARGLPLALLVLLMLSWIGFWLYQRRNRREDLYGALFEQTDNPILILQEGKIYRCNAQLAEILGQAQDHLYGKTLPELEVSGNWGNFLPKWSSALAELASNGKADFECFFLEQGRPRWMKIRLYQHQWHKQTLLLTVWHEITDRVRAEEQVRLELQEKNALINNTRDRIWSIDREMKLRSCNEPFLQAIATQIGRRLSPGDNVLAPEYEGDVVIAWKQIYQCALDGEIIHESYAFEGEGQPIYFEISLHPIYEQGQIIGVSCFSRDITEQTLATKALEKSESLHREYLERMPASYIAFDQDWRVTYVNQKASGLWGLEPLEMIGKVFWEEFPDAVGGEFYQALHKARAQGTFLYNEEFVPHWQRWLSDYIYPDAHGVSVFFHDITENKKTLESLRAGETILSLIYRSVAQMIILLRREPDGSFQVESANENFIQMLRPALPDVQPEDLKSLSILKISEYIGLFLESKNETELRQQLGVILQNEKMMRFGRNRLADGKHLAYEITVTPIVQPGPSPSYLLVVIDDVTEKVSETERTFIAINKAVEEERTYIARELHDSLTQTLSLASLNLKNLSYDIAGVSEQQKYRKALQFLEEGIEESRLIAHRIIPKSIQDFGLIPSLEELIEQTKRMHPIEIRFSYNRMIRLEPEQEVNLFRIVQQAITNTLTHAQAQEIQIRLEILDARINLEIQDDGIGFEYEGEPKTFNNIGILTMRSRALQLGGAFAIDSQPKQGTTLSVRVPLHHNYQENGEKN